jgi:hypothetical protein
MANKLLYAWTITILAIFLSIDVAAQLQNKEPAKPSLKETISWMANFSASHGDLYVGSKMIRHNSLSAIKGCAVSIEASFPGATASQPKRSTATVLLSDLARNSVREITDKDAGSYEVVFERSDASFVIEWINEMADGTKAGVYVTEGNLFFDSEESAKRFSRALVYAITLCGGHPSAF